MNAMGTVQAYMNELIMPCGDTLVHDVPPTSRSAQTLELPGNVL